MPTRQPSQNLSLVLDATVGLDQSVGPKGANRRTWTASNSVQEIDANPPLATSSPRSGVPLPWSQARAGEVRTLEMRPTRHQSVVGGWDLRLCPEA